MFGMLLYLVDLYLGYQIIALGSKMVQPQGHLFYIDSYREKLQKSSLKFLKLEGPGL